MMIQRVKNIKEQAGQTIIETVPGTTIVLPIGEHNITVLDMETPSDDYRIDIIIHFYHN